MKDGRILKLVLALAAVAIVAAFLFWLRSGGIASEGDDDVLEDEDAVEVVSSDEQGDQEEADSEDGSVGDDADESDAEAEDDDPDEKLVDAFEALVDGWMEPREGGVSIADSDAFVAAFGKLPEERREECLQRALNLLPDDNVMLLAGILMDKSIDQELIELVFNDILNRDEEVKKPILQEIFKDKSHPCWADTAWILDVTDELPE